MTALLLLEYTDLYGKISSGQINANFINSHSVLAVLHTYSGCPAMHTVLNGVVGGS